MNITVLVDNNPNPARPELRAEHGLSLFVEAGGARILFDTGASDLFLMNAKLLGIDPSTVDAVVLSHGHYDHGGGLAAFAEINKGAAIHLGQGAMDEHYIKVVGPLRKKIGLSRVLRAAIGERLIVVRGKREIAKNVFLVSPIEPGARIPSDRKLFFMKTGGSIRQDDFAHEVMLAIEEKNEVVLLTGCSHNGLMNMIEAAQKAFPGKTLKAVIGGFHLTNPITKKLGETPEYIRSIGQALAGNPRILKVISGHCTGIPAFGLLKQEMNEKLGQLEVGMRMVF
jgi:7,8-dihydropterin-6-yl-methyl-4-(beta-D-ribofuranosyl)aminobenzene 5'-phosphate synthase